MVTAEHHFTLIVSTQSSLWPERFGIGVYCLPTELTEQCDGGLLDYGALAVAGLAFTREPVRASCGCKIRSL